MSPLIIELADRAVCVARDGRVLASSPSAIFDGSATALPGSGATPGPAAGTDAWSALRLRPMATSTRHLSAVLNDPSASNRALTLVAAELTRRLTDVPLGSGEHLWVAAPAHAGAGGLGALLGIASSLPLPIDGFVDAAAVTVAALGLERHAIVLELGLHHAAATAVDADDGHARRRRAVSSLRGGLIELYQGWLELVSTAMVNRTRFDPLHDAATEQELFDALPAWIHQAAQSGHVTVGLSSGTERIEVTLSRDQFSQAAAPIYREVTRLLHELRPAGAPLALIVPRNAVELPGLQEELEQFAGCELISLPDGFAASAASLLDLPERRPEDPVRLLRRSSVQARAELAGEVMRRGLGARRVGGPAPSHVLFDGRAHSLSVDSLVVGRAPEAPNAITLPEGLAGVSRRHCTFVHDSGQLVLLDHSSFGTFVNGERVAERVRVYAGDRVRLGEPGAELSVIAVSDVATLT